MSHTEKTDYIKQLHKAIESYRGFTSSEKQYAKTNIYQWIDNNGSLDIFIKKFAEISVDIKPFLLEKSFVRA